MKIFNDNHPDIADSYFTIGNLYDSQNDLQQALANWSEAVTLYRNAYGENSNDVADTYENMAIAYETLNLLRKALELETEVLRIRRNLLGLEHPKVKKAQRIINRLQKK